MARAKRHFIPGYVWRIAYRCHKRDFPLKLVRDQDRWKDSLFEAKTMGLVTDTFHDAQKLLFVGENGPLRGASKNAVGSRLTVPILAPRTDR
jgi:hypothetical protein